MEEKWKREGGIEENTETRNKKGKESKKEKEKRKTNPAIGVKRKHRQLN